MQSIDRASLEDEIGTEDCPIVDFQVAQDESSLTNKLYLLRVARNATKKAGAKPNCQRDFGSRGSEVSHRATAGLARLLRPPPSGSRPIVRPAMLLLARKGRPTLSLGIGADAAARRTREKLRITGNWEIALGLTSLMVVLFLWLRLGTRVASRGLRAEMRDGRADLNGRMDKLEAAMMDLGARVVALGERVARVEGGLELIENYVRRRGGQPEDAAAE